MQAPARTPPNPKRKLTIGLACILGSFLLVWSVFTRIPAVGLFFYGVAEYIAGLVDNVNLKKAKQQASTQTPQASKTVLNPKRKLTIGLLCMLGSFFLSFPIMTGFLAVGLFLCGLVVYFAGLIENLSVTRTKKQASSQARQSAEK